MNETMPKKPTISTRLLIGSVVKNTLDEDLKSTLDEAAQQLSDTVLEIEDWEPWLVYLLEELEMLAASLDAQHPNGYKALLEGLKDDIEIKLQKGTWKNRISVAPPTIVRDYWS